MSDPSASYTKAVCPVCETIVDVGDFRAWGAGQCPGCGWQWWWDGGMENPVVDWAQTSISMSKVTEECIQALRTESESGIHREGSSADHNELIQTLWVVGRSYDPDSGDAAAWDLQGVFVTRDEAIAACRDWTYFIGEVVVGERLPHETVEWPGGEWPLWDQCPQKETTHYVVGFFFNKTKDCIMLMHKEKPRWQAGRLNGVGGKIEQGETPLQAMVRELQEETGIEEGKLRQFCCLQGGDKPPIFILHCFTAMLPLENASSIEAERIEVFSYPAILENPKLLSNLHWLLPLALDRDIALVKVLEVPSSEITMELVRREEGNSNNE